MNYTVYGGNTADGIPKFMCKASKIQTPKTTLFLYLVHKSMENSRINCSNSN